MINETRNYYKKRHLNSFWRYFALCVLLIGTMVLYPGYMDQLFADTKPNDTLAGSTAQIVWSEFDEGHFEIFYSQYVNNRWHLKTKLTNSNFDNLLPCISQGSDGVTWVVWAVLDGLNSQLFYAKSDGDKWTDAEKIPTGLSSNMAPSIVIDSKNRPQIVWAGFDGKVDNIYFTQWNGSEWEKPQKVNADNAVPDILPVIGISETGVLWVYWSGFDGGGRYRNYSSVRIGGQWEDETEENSNQNSYQSLIRQQLDSTPPLPDFLPDPNKAAIWLNGDNEVQSLPLHCLKK